jgi:hypothetical protein
MRARMPNALELRHPLPLIQSFSDYRLLSWFSHKKSVSKMPRLVETKTPRIVIEIEAFAFTDNRER